MMPILLFLRQWWYLFVIAGLVLALHETRSQLLITQAQFESFKDKTAALGEQQKAANAIKEKDDALKIAAANTARDAALASLRVASARPRAGFVPSAPAGSADSGKVCYGREALDAALRSLDTGVSRLLTEGDTQVINAVTLLKSWPSPSPVSGPPKR